MFAKVSKIHAHGMIMQMANPSHEYREVWLPSEEWSDDPQEWEAVARSQLTEELDEFDVVYIKPIGGYRGLPVVSRRQFTLAHVDDSWLWQRRLMTVTELTKTLVRGMIGKIDAVMSREKFESFLDERNLSSEMRDHGAIGPTDQIWGIVTKMGGLDATVELDPVQYLMGLEHTLADELSCSSPPSLEPARLDIVAVPPDLSQEVAGNIRYVLLLENDRSLRLSISRQLRHWHLEVRAAESLEDAEQIARAPSPEKVGQEASLQGHGVNLAIIDPNLNLENNDLRGMRIVKYLSEDPGWRILLMSGELKDEHKLERYGDVKVHVFEHKPLTSNLLVEAIEACLSMTQAIPLSKWIVKEDSHESDIEFRRPTPFSADFSVGTIAEPPRLKITSLLQNLANRKPATAIHVFAIHKRSFRAQSLAHAGLELNWGPFRGKIRKSRIKDVAFGHDLIVENVRKCPHLHLWTLNMMEYKSFCGIPIEISGSYRHALVAFHANEDAFNEEWVVTARLYAERAGRIFETQQLLKGREQEVAFATSGLAFECLAHELCNDLTDLNLDIDHIYDLLVGRHKEEQPVGADPVKALLACREEVIDAMKKVKLLRGVRATKSLVAVQPAVRQAGISCRRVVSDLLGHEIQHLVKIDILEEPWEHEWYVNIVPATLIVVIFNLYINAVQQMRLMSRLRNQGRVWLTLRSMSDSSGRQWGIIQVHDTGPGIHPEDWKEVFQPGYTTKPGGTGLGLYICRHLLNSVRYKDSRATINVSRSHLWSGTTVTIRLPLVPAQEIESHEAEK